MSIALLSIPSSEASMVQERTFSLQAAVHTKQRNRLLDRTVESQSEMFLWFNQNVRVKRAAIDDSCAEMVDDFDATVHAEAFALW